MGFLGGGGHGGEWCVSNKTTPRRISVSSTIKPRDPPNARQATHQVRVRTTRVFVSFQLTSLDHNTSGCFWACCRAMYSSAHIRNVFLHKSLVRNSTPPFPRSRPSPIPALAMPITWVRTFTITSSCTPIQAIPLCIKYHCTCLSIPTNI